MKGQYFKVLKYFLENEGDLKSFSRVQNYEGL